MVPGFTERECMLHDLRRRELVAQAAARAAIAAPPARPRRSLPLGRSCWWGTASRALRTTGWVGRRPLAERP